MNDGRALIVQGDALHLPLPDGSVDLIVTSPPYFALRSYSAGPGEIGIEPTPQAFLEALWAATAEMVRVLKPGGSMFVNLGDKYGGFQANPGTKPGFERKLFSSGQRGRHGKLPGSTPKSLCLLPERYRIGCVDQTSPYYRAEFYQGLANDLMDGETTIERARQRAAEFEASPKSKGLGLIARAVIVWDKPNGLPESVTDRVRRSHEDWVHLTREPRYYSATDEIREAHLPQSLVRNKVGGNKEKANWADDVAVQGKHKWEGGLNPLGKLPGSVWSIPSEPLRLPDHLGVQHYAAFPSEWPRRLILGFSPPGICVECGQGRVPVVERERIHDRKGDQPHAELGNGNARQRGQGETSALGWEQSATILGYACSCTPHTDHPGSGEGIRSVRKSSGSMPEKPRQDTLIHGGLGHTPRVGPWREYHLDRWTPPPTRPAIILDPFAGTGTTPMVARALGRIGVGVDLSHAYCRAARWRVKNDGGKAISRTWTERQTTLL